MGSGPRGAAQNYIGGQQDNLAKLRQPYQTGFDTQSATAQGNYAGALGTATKSATGGPSGGASIFAPSAGTYTDMASRGVTSLNPQAMTGFNNAGNTVNQATGMFGNVFNQPVDPKTAQAMLANGSFQNFINTGGFSNEDLQNMRAQAVSPIAAAAANAQQGINQTRALQGGYSPNTTAALAKSVRDLGYGSADAVTNANAQIAQLQQQGREFGTSGMSGAATNLADLTQRGQLAGAQGVAQTGLSEQQANEQIMQLDAQLKASGAAGLSDQEKAALSAQMGLTSGTAGVMQSTSANQLHNLDELQSGNMNLTNDYLQSYNLPTGFGSVMQGIGSVLGPISSAAGAFTGGFLPTSFGSSGPQLGGAAPGGFAGSQGSYGNIPMSQWSNFGNTGFVPPSNNGGVLENF